MLDQRADVDAAWSTNSTTCVTVDSDQLVISRTNFIVGITLSVFITGVSLLATTVLLYREFCRRRQTRAASAWGRKSMYRNRVSLARKQVDLSFSSQYSGCFVNAPENPEMGSDSPVEIMHEERVWEVPAIPSLPTQAKLLGGDLNGGTPKQKRKSKALSLFFDHGVGVWMPKR